MNLAAHFAQMLKKKILVMTHQVQSNILTFEAVLRKNMHLFLERCRRSNNIMAACFDAVRQYILPYSLNTTTAFYFATQCSDTAVFVRLRVCVSQCIRTLPGLDQFRN